MRAFDHYAEIYSGRVLRSIFFGGGTPSLMPPDLVAAIIEKAKSIWPSVNDLEITLEANPTSVEIDKFRAFSDVGVNRVSMGVQALNDRDLKFLGREHSVKDAMKAFDVAKECFDRVSFDLIYARPEQTLKDWESELRRAITHSAKHLSVYQLTIEQKTPFYAAHQRGDFSIPDQDVAGDFYDLTQDILSAAGMPAYEVSNHAVVGEESRHNLVYWQYDDYVGIGPGAHGRITLDDGAKYATRDHASPEGWLSKVEERGHGTHPFRVLDEKDQVMESLMMGLRLYDGMTLSPRHWTYLDRAKVQSLADQEWLVYSDDHIRLTREGIVRLNAVLSFIVR